LHNGHYGAYYHDAVIFRDAEALKSILTRPVLCYIHLMAKPMISITTDVKAWTRKMNRVNRELLPKAITETVNTACKGAHTRIVKNLRKDFTLRNTYTERSLKLWQSKYKPGRSIDRINATTGSISPYLPLQETGGVVRAKKSKIPVPTLAGRRGKWRRPIPPSLRMNRMGQIGGPSSKFFFMTGAGGKKGIFYRKSKKKVVKVRDISRRSYRVKGTRWHSKAVAHFAKASTFARIFVHHARRQLAKVKG